MSFSKDQILGMYPNTQYYVKNSNGGLLAGTMELEEAKKYADEFKKEYMDDKLNNKMEVYVFDRNGKQLYKADGEEKQKIKRIYVDSKEQFEKLYNSNALTLQGLDDTDKNLYSLVNWIKNLSEISNPLNIYIIKGKQMNEQYGLSGKNKYPDEFRIVCVDLEDIKQVQKIVIPRFEISGRWFNDVVDNDVRREGRGSIKPKCALIGKNGNIFNLMGIASRTLEENNMREKAKEMRERITSSNSYDEALGIIQEYVEVTDESDLEEEEFE